MTTFRAGNSLALLKSMSSIRAMVLSLLLPLGLPAARMSFLIPFPPNPCHCMSPVFKDRGSQGRNEFGVASCAPGEVSRGHVSNLLLPSWSKLPFVPTCYIRTAEKESLSGNVLSKHLCTCPSQPAGLLFKGNRFSNVSPKHTSHLLPPVLNQ